MASSIHRVLSADTCTHSGAYCVLDSKPQTIDTLKLSPTQWKQLQFSIKKMQVATEQFACYRTHHRADDLNLMQVPIEVFQPGGTMSYILARAINISTGGLGYFHGRFVYPESRCTVWLRHAAEGMVPIHGTIRWCKHFSGAVHLSGLEFDDNIDVFRYLPQT